MISALQERARIDPPPADASEIEMTGNYLEACHLIFEKGILSHMTRYQRVVQNIEKGFQVFKEWHTCHQNTEYPDNSKKARQRKFLAWQVFHHPSPFLQQHQRNHKNLQVVLAPQD